MLQSQLLEITTKLLPHGLNENFTTSLTIHDEGTLFWKEKGKEVNTCKGERKAPPCKRKGRDLKDRWWIFVKSLFLNHHATIISLQSISVPKSVKLETNVVGETARE